MADELEKGVPVVRNAPNLTEDDRSLDGKDEIALKSHAISTIITLSDEVTDASNPFFIRNLVYSAEEELRVVRILDTRLFPWILLTTFVLNMDRTNHANAISDNLPQDLGFNINVVNTGTAIYAVLFSLFCLVGAVMAKWMGPARCIPVLMFAWGLVTAAHALVQDKPGYLAARAWIAITEGGFIPASLVYLGGFYKSNELATRLAWFWGVQNMASAVSGLMASGLLRLRGIADLEGWKWLFIIDGILTLIVAVMTWFYLPAGVSSTKGGMRGRKPWFTEREIQISVTRLVRDDPSKRLYESNVTLADVKDAVTDLGLWGHLILTAIGLTPLGPLQTYLPTVIKSFHFDVFASNALTAPPWVLQCATSVLVIWHSDRTGERGIHGALSASWMLAGWILLRALPSSTSRGVKYLAACIITSWPMTHPLNIAWMSENTGSVGKRTVASGAVIGAANIFALWASQIYQAKDAPDFKVGNVINIAFSGTAVILWFVQKTYYKYRNRKNAKIRERMGDEEFKEEEANLEVRGNASPLFKFTT